MESTNPLGQADKGGPNAAEAGGNRELEEFTRAVSHELKTTLWIMGFCCDRLQKNYRNRLDPETEKFIDGAGNAVKKTGRTLDSLLEYVRVSKGDKPIEPIEFQPVLEQVQQALQPLIDQAQARITHDSLPTVQANREQLGRLLANLLDNAIRYRRETPPEIHIAARPTDGHWEFQVRDNGCGIEPRNWDEAFKICTRLHKNEEDDTAGMGLALCKRIVERHGGHIRLESTPGQGTTVFFTLPKV